MKDETEMTKTTIRLPKALWTAAQHRALDEGTDGQTVVAEALRAYLKTPIRKEVRS